jgi:hypothetical protein
VRQAILQIQKNAVVQEHNEWAKMLFEHISVRSPELLKASHRFGVFSASHRYGPVVASKGCNGYHCGCIARLLIVRVSTSTGGGMDSLSFTLHELEAHGSTRSYNALMAPAEGVLDSLSFTPHFAVGARTLLAT